LQETALSDRLLGLGEGDQVDSFRAHKSTSVGIEQRGSDLAYRFKKKLTGISSE
jgi:hypothetical protein